MIQQQQQQQQQTARLPSANLPTTDLPTASRHQPTAELASGARGVVVHSTLCPTLGRIDIAVLDPDGDLELIYEWVQRPSSHFWGMLELSRQEVQERYLFVESLPTHHALVVRRDGLPIVLLQTYQPQHDPLGEVYEAAPTDVGIHFLLGDRGARVPRFSTLMPKILLDFLFSADHTLRVVVEPDVGNLRAIARARKLGFELGPQVDLAEKRAQLAFLTRERWQGLRCALSAGTSL